MKHYGLNKSCLICTLKSTKKKLETRNLFRLLSFESIFLNVGGILWRPLLFSTHYNVCSMITSIIHENAHFFDYISMKVCWCDKFLIMFKPTFGHLYLVKLTSLVKTTYNIINVYYWWEIPDMRNTIQAFSSPPNIFLFLSDDEITKMWVWSWIRIKMLSLCITNMSDWKTRLNVSIHN